MSVPIPLRVDFDAVQLRGLARKTKDGPQARRLLALAAIYDGAMRTEAAKIGGVGLQIIRDWVLRFNARGPDGLLDGKSPGQPSRLNDAQRQAIGLMIENGPSRRSMAWCAGGWSIWRNGSSRSSASPSPSRRSAGNCAPWAIASCQPARAMPSQRVWSRLLKTYGPPRCK